MQSLQKGNRQAVTLIQDGKEQRQFVEAKPQFKSITVYYSNIKKVNNQVQKEREPHQQSSKQQVKKGMESGDNEADPVAKQPQKSRRKKSISVS